MYSYLGGAYFASGIEMEILFVIVIQSEVEGRQLQKDCNGKPARTPKTKISLNKKSSLDTPNWILLILIKA